MTEYRIDDLAREAGTTTRNIRGYQDRGLIPRPVRRGRISIYNDLHLQRLRVINDLLRKGFTMSHIGEFFKGVQRGDDLAEVLGLRELIEEPWSHTRSEKVTAAELHSRVRTSDPAQLERLAKVDLIRPVGEVDPPEEYLITDVDSITAITEMMDVGIPFAWILRLQEQLDEDMSRAAVTLISAGRKAITEGRFDGWIPESDAESDWAAVFMMSLRRTGRLAAHNTLFRALDRELQRQFDDYLSIARERREASEHNE